MSRKENPLYLRWKGMRGRCNCSPNDPDYVLYAGRGIGICEEWSDFNKFEEWALNNGFSRELTLDRIDNDGDYGPHNCRFVSMSVQNRNKRDNRLITYQGETLCLADWADRLELDYDTIRTRLDDGWPKEKALGASLRGYRKNERLLTCRGETLNLSEWSRRIGLSPQAISRRIDNHGWSEERALLTPKRNRKRRFLGNDL